MPTLRRIRDFLRKNTFDPSVQKIATNLANSINKRVETLVDNTALRMTCLLDPRFAYQKEVFSAIRWTLIEDDIKQLARRSR